MGGMKREVYPFTAIVGQERMRMALMLNAVDPSIGGVLIRGHKGTGKSTAVRGLPGILPSIEVVEGCPFQCPPDSGRGMHDGCRERLARGETLPRATIPTPLVEMPLNATEDRVAGTLHIEHALRTGQRRFEPGLLAAANRGILYVDEVNLLDDHLVDLLLDAAASGVNVVEREGISESHPARFILVGTMNPEEGELRPQFLDRFGLCVFVESLVETEQRKEIVLRRMEFERTPDSFVEEWAEAEGSLAGKIARARDSLDDVRIPGELLELAVRLVVEVEVHGHRADLAILRTARALAALLEKEEVERSDLVEAAHYVLPHRIRKTLFSTNEKLVAAIDDALASALGKGRAAGEEGDWEAALDEDELTEAMQIPGAGAAGSILLSFEKKNLKSVFTTPTG